MAVASGSDAIEKNQVVSAVVPTTLRQTCIMGSGVAMLTLRTRMTTNMKASPISPR